MHDTRAIAQRLWNDWMHMWNGEPALARQLVGPGFRLHLAVPAIDPRTVNDGESVARWVAGFRAGFTRITFDRGCGPFVDETTGLVSGPWTAESVKDGVTTRHAGIDIFAVEDGRIVEYWTLSREVDPARVAPWVDRGP